MRTLLQYLGACTIALSLYLAIGIMQQHDETEADLAATAIACQQQRLSELSLIHKSEYMTGFGTTMTFVTTTHDHTHTHPQEGCK